MKEGTNLLLLLLSVVVHYHLRIRKEESLG